MATQPSEGQVVAIASGETQQKKGCGFLSLDGHKESWGVNFNGIGRGAISMSNVYLANSMILLACREAGGANEAGTVCLDRRVRIYGQTPATIVSNIAAFAPLIAACVMPLIGAIVDFTPHRRMVGIVMAFLLFFISAIQIGTVDETWFAMAILQAIIFAVYQLELTILYAYYPEIRRDVGDKKIVDYMGTFYFNQFCSQAGVNAVILICLSNLALGTIKAAWLSQGITALMCLICMPLCWRLLPKRPRRHALPKGKSLWAAGCRQNFYMAKVIWRSYKAGFRWFLISTIFSEAAASAVGSTAVIFLGLHLKLNGFQIGLFFEISLFGVIFGTKLGTLVAKFTNPNISLQLSNIGLCLTVIIGCWTVEYAPRVGLTFIWGFSIGIFLGWFYAVEALFLSISVPINVETELAGFFNFCSQILAWLPPLAFTIVVEANLELPWALSVVGIFFIPGVFFLTLCGKWEDIVKEGETIEVDFYEHMRLSAIDTGAVDEVEKPAEEKPKTDPEKIDSC